MSQQTNQQITDKIAAAYTGGADRVEWTNELRIIVQDLNDSKVNNDDIPSLDLIEITYADAAAAIAANELKPGRLYKITDRSYGQGIFVRALTVNSFDPSAVRILPCPLWYSTGIAPFETWQGVWRSERSFTAGDRAIWGGRVWINLTGAAGSADDDITLDAVNWEEAARVPGANYENRAFSCTYNFTDDHIGYQWDEHGNKVGVGHPENEYYDLPMVDVTDWNGWKMDPAGTNWPFLNNKAAAFFNNVIVDGYSIENNDCGNYGELKNNGRAGGTIYIANNVAHTGITNNNFTTAAPANSSIVSNYALDGIADNTILQIIKNRCTTISNNVVADVTGQGITNNTAQNIQGNTCKEINENLVGKAITNNNNAAMSITQNIVGGFITTNTNGFAIGRNIIASDIANNSNNGTIYNNRALEITGNSNNGTIDENVTTLGINNNSNNGYIRTNRCNLIQLNANAGLIWGNANNGNITNLTAAASDVSFNNNNGSIGATATGSVSDPVVDK